MLSDNDSLKMLYFCTKIIYVTSFWCPSPLTTLVAPNGTIVPYLDISNRKVEQMSRRYSRCDACRVTDINSIYPRHVKTCLMSIGINKDADQPACAV